MLSFWPIFAARRYANVYYPMAGFACRSVCPSQACIISKRLNVSSSN